MTIALILKHVAAKNIGSQRFGVRYICIISGAQEPFEHVKIRSDPQV
jgi:hypothetical protein